MNRFATVEPSALGYLALDPEAPVPYVFSSRMLSGVTAAGIDAFVEAAGAGPEVVMAELRSLGGALGRPTPGTAHARSSRATTWSTRLVRCSRRRRTARRSPA